MTRTLEKREWFSRKNLTIGAHISVWSLIIFLPLLKYKRRAKPTHLHQQLRYPDQ